MLIKRDPSSDSSPIVELTPIIDMVFLLLIFFLVATTFHQSEREMQIALPVSEASGPISQAARELVINVTNTGQIIANGQSVDEEGLRAIVTRAVEQNPDQKVIIRGDREASYGMVARALDVCKAAGIQEPFLDTVPVK